MNSKLNSTRFAALGLLTLSTLVATAQANEALAKKNACMACHAVDEKVVGPSYTEVAKKYAGQEGATAKLAESIRKGGTGVWGKIPMPEQAQLSAEDAKTLAAWILAMNKTK